MSATHSHSHAAPPDVEIGRLPRLILVAGIVLAAVATVIGVVAMWPSADERVPPVAYAAEGAEAVPAEVVSLSEPCPVIAVDPTVPPTGEQPAFPEHCNEATFSVEDETQDVTFQVPPNVLAAGLEAGDAVKLIAFPGVDGEVQYGFYGVDRDFPIALMAIVFVLVTALVAGFRGIRALVGLGVAGYIVAMFMLPALLAGESGFGVALAGSSLIMLVVLYLAHGVSIRTSAALGGTLIAVLITALIGLWGIEASRLSGISDDDGELLLLHAPDLSFPGLLASAVIIAGLGVLNDVTITQTSAVWELRAAGPELSRRQLFSSGMRIGRDHIASSIYTIVFAYAGTALVVLMLISLYDRPLLDLFVDESIGEEVVRTLASATGLVLAVPITTAIAALTVGGPGRGAVRSRSGSGARRA